MIRSRVTVTGPSSGSGVNENSCVEPIINDVVFNGAGSRLSELAKFIERRMAKARLAVRTRAPPPSGGPRATYVTAPPQRTPPSATPPCEAIRLTAFIRPRAQSGIARCPAIQSSEADTVQLMPARAVTGKNIQRFGTMDIKTSTTTSGTPAKIVSVFGLTLARA